MAVSFIAAGAFLSTTWKPQMIGCRKPCLKLQRKRIPPVHIIKTEHPMKMNAWALITLTPSTTPSSKCHLFQRHEVNFKENELLARAVACKCAFASMAPPSFL